MKDIASFIALNPAKPPVLTRAIHVAVMGVAGCGKSALAERIAAQLQLPLIEGDAFHPDGNIAKMQRGLALTDADRADWLNTLSAELGKHASGAVLTCSALRASYRNTLRHATPLLRFVHSSIPQTLALQRVAGRPGHIFPPSLVASQFAALEDPAGEPGVLVLDGALPLDALAALATRWLAASLA